MAGMLGESMDLMLYLLLCVNALLVVILALIWRRVRQLQAGMDFVEEALAEASQQLADAGEQLRGVVHSIYADYREKDKKPQPQQQRPAVRNNEEVLQLLNRGYDFKAIADRLGVSVDHVRLVGRIHNIYPKNDS